MAQRLRILDLIDKHRTLDYAIRDNRANFLSDWNGDHPYVTRFLGPHLSDRGPQRKSRARYVFFDDEAAVLNGIRSLHLKWEGLNLSSQNIVAGPGSSSFLVAFSLWLLQRGESEVYYIPPLYYTFHYFMRTLGIKLRPIAGKQVFEPGFTMNLPRRRSVLMLCDPVWYAGRRVPLPVMQTIKKWQTQTNSLVFVDGSFQYMQWDATRKENSSILSPDLTFRLVSLTKALAIPFFRFAYLLHPSKNHDEFMFLYESIVGGATWSDYEFAQRALKVLSTHASNTRLTTFLKNTYDDLIRRDIISTDVLPECGYFAFAVPRMRAPGQITMEQDYFELKGYPNYVRINLMVAHKLYKSSLACQSVHQKQ